MNTDKARRLLPIILLVVGVFFSGAQTAQAGSAAEIDARVQEALNQFYEETHAGKMLARKAKGILIFPRVKKGGIGIGGEYGQGSLRVGSKTLDYYSITSASIGLQLGFQVKTEVILFMTQKALKDFRESEKWEVGADGSVAVVEWGAGGEIDSQNINDPIIGFIFGNEGLMFNLSFEGAKISKLYDKH